jgi:hypothetical protein
MKAIKIGNPTVMITRFWPFVFWIWVVFVSLWIEHAPVREFASPVVEQQFSDFQFKQMRFEQREEDNSLLVVESPDARFHSKEKHFYLVEPRLEWIGKKEDDVFSATGSIGVVSSHLAETALPSEFRILELSQGASLKKGDTSIDSERMLYDNEKRLFYFPDTCTIKKANAIQSRMKGMVYDPLMEKISPMKENKPL